MDSTRNSSQVAFDSLRRMISRNALLRNSKLVLPRSGAFFSVSSTLGTVDHSSKWFPLASANTGRSLSNHDDVYQPTLPAAGKGPSGRGAAAIASVACRQFGFMHASVVMNCGALLLLELGSSDNLACAESDWIRTSDGGWGCKTEWQGQPSELLRSLCGDLHRIRHNATARIAWSGLGTDAQTDSRWRFSSNPADPFKVGGSDNPSMYMATTASEADFPLLEPDKDDSMYRRHVNGHAAVFSGRGWSMSMQPQDENAAGGEHLAK
eukprot:COSAG01_NODE_1365_length_10560_cov_38.008986_3_plen_266_part_00